jgi:hypothetical protein
MSNTSRIEIYGQGGACDRSKVEISHAMPAIVGGFIDPNDWEIFCNKLDVTLEPMQAVKNIQLCLVIGGISTIVIFFIWACVSYANLENNSSSNEYDSWWIYIVVIGGLLIFVPLFLKLYSTQKTHAIKNALKRVCDEESSKYPQMTFQLRFETFLGFGKGNSKNNVNARTFNYLEVIVAMTAMPQKPVAGQFMGVTQQVFTPVIQVPSAQEGDVEVGGGSRSAAERLADLENIRGVLSAEQYEQKKQQILDSL